MWFLVDPPVDTINAPAIIQTRHAGTFIDVDLTVLALEAVHTLTCVHGNIVSAGGAVLARLYFTLINLYFTVNT